MFFKLSRYLGLVLLGISFSAWADKAPTLADLGMQIKQSEENILNQISGEKSAQIIGYFDAKSRKIHKKARKNSQFFRQVWGKTDDGDWVMQDFYVGDDAENQQPMTSMFILPKERKRHLHQKKIVGVFQAAAFARYRENGLPESMMLFDDAYVVQKMYQFNENGQVSKMFDVGDILETWLFYDNGTPKSHMKDLNLSSWYENGQQRLQLNKNGDGQMWYENGTLYYQNSENKVEFFHENGQLAISVASHDIQAWDENGNPINEKLSDILKPHLIKVQQTRDEILRELNAAP